MASSAAESYQAPQTIIVQPPAAPETIYAPPSYYAQPELPPVAQGGYPSDVPPASYYGTAPQAPAQTMPPRSDVVHCSAGRFFNTLTESCDTR